MTLKWNLDDLFKTEEDLDKYYQELKFCFQLKKMLDLKNPTRRER